MKQPPTTVQWIRQAAQRLSRGSARLATLITGRAAQAGTAPARGIRGWLDGATGLSWLLRVALLVLGALVLRRILAGIAGGLVHRIETSRTLLWLAATVWLIAAYRVGREDWKPRLRPGAEQSEQVTVERAEDAPVDGDEPDAEQAPEGPPLPILPDLRISLARVGTPHAHLAVLAADIDTTPERVREALDKWEIPVEAVRMQGRGTSTGVKGGPAVHPALAFRPEDVAVVAAGQPGNNDNNNALRVEHGQGMTIIRDPADVHRRHTVGH